MIWGSFLRQLVTSSLGVGVEVIIDERLTSGISSEAWEIDDLNAFDFAELPGFPVLVRKKITPDSSILVEPTPIKQTDSIFTPRDLSADKCLV
jgi:hypothetical protein